MESKPTNKKRTILDFMPQKVSEPTSAKKLKLSPAQGKMSLITKNDKYLKVVSGHVLDTEGNKENKPLKLAGFDLDWTLI